MSRQKFIYKPLSVIQDKRLSPLEQDYLCLIAGLEAVSGCTASNNYFADYFGVKRQSAQEVIRRLKSKKFIRCTEAKEGGKTIERTIQIIDDVSRKTLLMDGRDNLPMDSMKSPVGLAGNSDKVSRKLPTHITKSITNNKTNIYPQDSIELNLAILLFDLICERKPDFKAPNLQSWSKHIDLMIRLDKRNPETIEKIIRWCQADSGNGTWMGWQNNILSTAKLREKFDKIELAMQNNTSDRKSNNSIRPSFADQQSQYGETIEV